jgi:hypothetical protein
MHNLALFFGRTKFEFHRLKHWHVVLACTAVIAATAIRV